MNRVDEWINCFQIRKCRATWTRDRKKIMFKGTTDVPNDHNVQHTHAHTKKCETIGEKN